MTLYYQMIFGVLVAEIVTLTLLVGPLPLAVRHQIVKLQRTPGYITSALSYGIKLALLANTVFFVDSVQRVQRLTAEAALARHDNPGQMNDVATHASFTARKVYAQRNMYMTGFTLFCAFLVVRCFNLVAGMTHAEDRVLELEAAKERVVATHADAAAAPNAVQNEKKQKAALDNMSRQAQ